MPKEPWLWHTAEEGEARVEALLDTAVCPVCGGLLSKSLKSKDESKVFCGRGSNACKKHLDRIDQETLEIVQKKTSQARRLFLKLREDLKAIREAERIFGKVQEEALQEGFSGGGDSEELTDMYVSADKEFEQLIAIVSEWFRADQLEPRLRRQVPPSSQPEC